GGRGRGVGTGVHPLAGGGGAVAGRGGEAAPEAGALSGARRCLVAGLCVWGVGAQIREPVAAVGMGVVVVGLIWTRGPWRTWRAFWPVGLYVGWALLAPLLAGQVPSSGGFFRTLDWAFMAAGALAFAELDERGRRAVAVACGAALLVSCLAAALQFFGA